MKKYIDTNLCIMQSTPADPNYKDPNYCVESYDKYTGFIRDEKYCYTEEEALAEARRLNKEERAKAKAKNRNVRFEYSACVLEIK